MRLYCYADGAMFIGSRLPDGALPIEQGSREDLEQIMQRGRRSYGKGPWLVPGVPEADDELEAVDALRRFIAWAVCRQGRTSAKA